MDNIKKFFKGVTSSSPDPIQSMQIILDNPSATYHTGEIISGHLIVQVNTSVNISQFEVKFSGKATVKLTDVSRRPSDRRESSTSVASNRNYCLESYNLVRLIYNPATGEYRLDVFSQQQQNMFCFRFSLHQRFECRSPRYWFQFCCA